MKLVLNRQEVRAFRKAVRAMEAITGIQNMIDIDDFKITKVGYMKAMVSGSLTIDVTTEAFVAYTQLTTDMVNDLAPIVTVLKGAGQSLMLWSERYAKADAELEAIYNADVNPSQWNVTNITVETTPPINMEDDREVV